jgi:hypothetical protein
MDLKNMTQMDMSPDILSLWTFCLLGCFVPPMLYLRMFCLRDVLSLLTFCLAGCFVPPDVLLLYVMSPDVLSGHHKTTAP